MRVPPKDSLTPDEQRAFVAEWEKYVQAHIDAVIRDAREAFGATYGSTRIPYAEECLANYGEALIRAGPWPE